MPVKDGRVHGMGFAATHPAETVVVHHWEQGPGNVSKVAPFWAKRRDGWHQYEWKFYWYLHKVEGTTRSKALRAIYGVLRNPYSWERCGVRWIRTMNPTRAHIRLSVIPAATTACGAGAAGCYWGGHPYGKGAELGVEYIDSPFWAELVGMELQGHGTFSMHDMYIGEGHGGYIGVMGNGGFAQLPAYYPTMDEILWTKQWLLGQALYVHREH